jgi:hypothetical protein
MLPLEQAVVRLRNRLAAIAMQSWHERTLLMRRVKKMMGMMLGKRHRETFKR